LTGLAAFLAILIALIGVPVVLWALKGNPIPSHLPSWDTIKTTLSSPDDGSMFTGFLVIAGWAGWLLFATSIAFDAGARIRHIETPKIPALGMSQRAAGVLVGAAGLLFTSAPLLASASPALADTPSATTTVAVASAHPAPTTKVAEQPETSQPTTRTYNVKPGDTLWSIAETELHDPHRYQQIADLNYGAPQADGKTLDSSHWIRHGWTLQLPTTPTPATSPTHTHTVRTGENLSQIAQRELGNPNLSSEIATASAGLPQPGGEHLTNPNLIKPGWTVAIPTTGTTPPPTIHPATPAPAKPAAPAIPTPPPPARMPAPTTSQTPQQNTPPQVPSNQQETPATTDTADEAFPIRTTTGIGALLAAGLLGLIALRRAGQQRHRRAGQTTPMPTGQAAALEQDLRATADPLSVETVDLALRTLAAQCSAESKPLPIVRAARLTAEQFDLYLAEPATLPAPWQSAAGDTVWSLPADQEDLLDTETAKEIPAPYPSLVTIGHDTEDGHILLDLEHIGTLGITADDDTARQIITAIAIELATSIWADDLQVTIVGDHADLEDAFQTGRIRHLPAASDFLTELTARAANDRAILTATGANNLNHARTQSIAPGIWTPEILLLTGTITTNEREQIAELIQQIPRVAIAAVTNGEPVGEWTIRGETDDYVLDPIGIRIRPQTIDADTYTHLLQILHTATTDTAPTHLEKQIPEPGLAYLPTVTQSQTAEPATDETTPGEADASEIDLGEDTPPAPPKPNIQDLTAQCEGIPAAEATTITKPASTITDPEQLHIDDIATTTDRHKNPDRGPRFLILGPIQIENTKGPVEPSRKSRLTELGIFIALHSGVNSPRIDAAIWPKSRNPQNTRDTQMSKLRKWLGANNAGEAYLPAYPPPNGFQFTDDIDTDWDSWNEALPDGPQKATTEQLEEALRLVRGRPFEDANKRYYAWAETIQQTMIDAIGNAAYELGRRRIIEGHWQAAETALVTGLTVEPVREQLWRARILAAHGSGDTTARDEAIERLYAIADNLGGDLEPETEQLLQQLQDPTASPAELTTHAMGARQ
jgi:DNA-binding SARP family transcriptional activator/LysM repeat protein